MPELPANGCTWERNVSQIFKWINGWLPFVATKIEPFFSIEPGRCHKVFGRKGAIRLDKKVELSNKTKVVVFSFPAVKKHRGLVNLVPFLFVPFRQVWVLMQNPLIAMVPIAEVLNWDLRSECILWKFLLLSQGLLANHLPINQQNVTKSEVGSSHPVF